MPVKREKDIVKKEMKQEKVAETCCDGEEKGEVKKENVAGKTEGVVKEETLIVKKETRHTMIVKKEMKQEKVAETCCDGEEKDEGVVKIEPVGVKKENAAGKLEVSGSVKEETRPYSPAQLAALAALGTWRWQHVTQPWASVAPA
jgi:hypothetical protein